MNCGRFCFFGAVSLWFFCLCMKHLGNRWTDLRQIHTQDVFGPSLGRVWRPRSKLKDQGHQGQKTAFSTLSAACVRFVFGQTSLASSSFFLAYSFLPTTSKCDLHLLPISHRNTYKLYLLTWKTLLVVQPLPLNQSHCVFHPDTYVLLTQILWSDHPHQVHKRMCLIW